MLDIAKNEISTFNGLGADGQGWQTAQDMINTTANAAANVINAINSGNNNNSSSDQQQNIPTRPAGNNNSNNNNNKQSDIMDYLPWIAGGLGLILLITVMSNNKK